MQDLTPLSLKEAAERVGVKPALRQAAVAHARIVARLGQRGHRLEHIREASRQVVRRSVTR
jgi:hypothetical protein